MPRSHNNSLCTLLPSAAAAEGLAYCMRPSRQNSLEKAGGKEKARSQFFIQNLEGRTQARRGKGSARLGGYQPHF